MKTNESEKVVDMEYHKAEIQKRDARIAELEGALTDTQTKLDQILKCCKPYTKQVWAAIVGGIILDCEFWDTRSKIAKIEGEK